MKNFLCRQWIQKYAWIKIVLCAAGAALFLGLVYIVIYHDVAWWDLWLATGTNNDEVIYNRQLAGVLTGGQPKGVFGYDEDRAVIGHFSVWGPVIFFLYAIPGLLAGVGVNTVFWCNIFFAVAGWAVFVWGTRISWKKQLLFGAAIFCCWYPLQQIFSGTAEPLQIFLIFCILGASAALARGFRWSWFAVLALGCFFITVTRAYTVVFWLFPCVLLRKRKKLSAVCAGMAAVSLAAYFVVTKFFSAAFFSGQGVDLKALEYLLQGDVPGAIHSLLQHFAERLASLWGSAILPACRGQMDMLGVAALQLCFLLVVTLAFLVWDKVHGNAVRFKLISIAIVAISICGLLSLYEVYAMSRHFVMLGILLVMALVYEDRFAVCFCLLFLLFLPYHFSAVDLPVYDADMDQEMQIIQQSLEERNNAQDSDDPWDYTLAYAFRDDVFHGYLYAVPAGMGIQFDRNTYLADPNNPIHSRYVMVEHGGDAEARLLADGWQQLVSTEALVVYERPDTAQ